CGAPLPLPPVPTRRSSDLAGEFLLHDGIEVDGQAGEDHQADQTELDHPAEPPTSGPDRLFLARNGIGGMLHGGGLYALYPQDVGRPVGKSWQKRNTSRRIAMIELRRGKRS